MFRDAMKKILAIMVISILLIIMILPISTYSVEQQNVIVSVTAKPKIDIVLAKANTATNVTTFEADILNALRNKNIDPSDVKIQAVEAAKVDLTKTFSWQQDVSSTIGSIAITNNGQNVEMVGNYSQPGKNAIWINPPRSNEDQKFNFDYNIDFGDSFNAAGMLLKVKDNGTYLTGYMLSFNNSGGQNWVSQANNCNGAIWEFTYQKNDNTNNITKVLKKGIAINKSGNLTITVTDTEIKVEGGGLASPEIYEMENEFGSGYGFFSDHYSHGCDSYGKFTLANINLETIQVKEFDEVLRQPEWRTASYRFLVNISDRENNELKNENIYSELVTRLINDNINYIAWGLEKNRVQYENMVAQNPGKGTFILNTDYDTSIETTAEYIKTVLGSIQSSEYVLIDEPVKVEVNPESAKTNTEDTDWPYGKWKIIHDYEYYENNLGQFEESGKYISGMITTFDKTGKYQLTYRDQVITPENIYVHRRPIASFSMIITGNQIELKSSSFDLDELSNNNGIQEEEWSWKESTATSWNSGKLSTFDTSKSYMIRLRVKDWQNTWSDYITKFIDINSSAKPVALFNIDKTTITKYENIEITDESYDPSGRQITTYNWSIIKDGTTVYSGTSIPTDISTYPVGTYFLHLKVANSLGTESEETSRMFEVIDDDIAPSVVATPIQSEWEKSVTVNLKFSDDGHSGFKQYKYVITDSQTIPGNSEYSAWIQEQNSKVIINKEGSNKYLHIIAEDNAGNVSEDRIIGPYKIDSTGPNIIVNTISKDNEANLTIRGTDLLSGVKEYYLVTPNGDKIKNNSGLYTLKTPGIYTAYAVDFVGNESTKEEVEVKMYFDLTVNPHTGEWNGTKENSKKTLLNGDKIEIENPTKLGYTFVGWELEGKNSSLNGNEFTMGIQNATLTAKWIPNPDTKYYVEYYLQNTSYTNYDLIESKQFEGTTDTIATAIPKEFIGFTYDEGNVLNIKEGNIDPDGSRVLKLFYSRNIYNVTLNTTGGKINEGNVANYIYGVGATLPTNVTKDGYVFKGWYDIDKKHENSLYDTKITTEEYGDKIYYAIWESSEDTKYVVEHYIQRKDLSGYDLKETENLTGVTNTIVSGIPKSYIGFSENTAHVDRIEKGQVKEDGSLILKIYYDRNINVVTFKNDGVVIDTQNIVFGDNATAPIISKTGYTLSWDKEFNDIQEDVIVNAIWTPNINTKYEVKHYIQKSDLSGYDLKEIENLEGTTNNIVSAIPKSYIGYRENSSYSATVAKGVIKADGSLVLELYYDIITNLIVFKDAGLVIDTQNIQYGKNAIAPIIIKSGYELSWDTSFDNIKESYTVNAVWTPKENTSYTVEYYIQKEDMTGYILKDSYSLKGITDSNVDIEISNIEGFTFDNTNINNILTGNIAGNGSLILKAYYNRNIYTVDLDLNGGTINTGIITNYTYGIEQKLPTDITKEGYNFIGWFDSNTQNEENACTVKIEKGEQGNKKYYAVWKASSGITYKIEHYQQNKNLNSYRLVEVETKTGITNTNVVAIPKNYSEFQEDVSNTQRIEQGIVLADGSLVLKLYYNRNVYDVELNTNGGTINSNNINQYCYGIGETLPVDVTKKGYDFAGWYLNEYYTGEVITKIKDTDTGNKELYAKWIPRKDTEYKTKYYLQNINLNGYNLDEISVLKGTTESNVKAIIRDYEGFIYDEDLSNVRGNITGDGDLTFKVYYVRETYDVVLNTNEGVINSGNITKYAYKQNLELPTDITKEGYIFAGWFDNEEFEGEQISNIPIDAREDKIYFAKWEEIIEEPDTLYLKSNKYKIEENYIEKIVPGTTVKTLKENLNTNGEITILDKKGNEITDEEIVGTGFVIKDLYEDEEIELTLVVTGDIDGNGEITALDLSAINQHMLKIITLLNENARAADMNKNGEITALDLSAINQVLLKIFIL